MIAIIGSNHDDILYFETVMKNKTTETVLNHFEATIGTIFNQEVLILHGANTSILSSALTTYLCSKYYLDLIIVVGRCFAISKKLKLGDIIISNKILNVDIDLIDEHGVLLGQIPELPQIYEVQNDIIGYLEEGLNKRVFSNGKRVTVLSSDDLSHDNLLKIQEKEKDNNEESFVVDSISGGIAVGSYLAKVPFVVIKTVETVLGEQWNVENYIQVLDTYVNMDKAVVSAIGDIGRNDVIIGGTRK